MSNNRYSLKGSTSLRKSTMAKSIGFILFIILFVPAAVFGVDLECHMGVTECMEPIRNYSQSMQGGRFVPYMSIEQFNTFCQKYKDVDDCMKEVTCSDEWTRVYDGIDGAMAFMCEEQPQGYPSYARCVTHPVINTEIQECNKLIQQMETPAQACVPYNDFLHCGFNTLEKHCDENEALWFETLLVRSVKPVLEFHGCEIEKPSEKNSHEAGVIAGVVIAVIAVIILAAVIAIYLRRRGKRAGKGYQPTKSALV